ncbi:protein NRT1/ PTR FAMILY 5.10-like [Helianthus annuus]|uniref:protein NRT1/ PTR FAMILY 5.10-like n=1 Tax=Helianthus annuus TaxID=4232 RepID=UPI001652FEB2|nr:protein NRT1/ PTR FAMILY 5.10-like [Helianthus annuus]
MLQRIGIGLFISIVSMVVAAIVETKRLNIARKYGLLDDPNAMIPMKIWWLLPQCVLAGAGDVFTIIGGNDQDGWIPDNLNQGHVDYFYYLLAGLSVVAFVIFIYAAKSYMQHDVIVAKAAYIKDVSGFTTLLLINVDFIPLSLGFQI